MRRLKILGRHKPNDTVHYSIFLCENCHREVEKQTSNGLRQECCGCVPRNLTHGMVDTELYRKWYNMKTRCSNPKATQYPWYGAKGISYVEAWESFMVFRDWSFSQGYEDNRDLVLSRLDHEDNYSPENCVYTSRSANCKDAMERRWGNKAKENQHGKDNDSN